MWMCISQKRKAAELLLDAEARPRGRAGRCRAQEESSMSGAGAAKWEPVRVRERMELVVS